MGLQSEFESNLTSLKSFQPHARVNVLLQDSLRILGRHLFNLHATGRRGHEYRLTLRAIHKNAKIKFLLDRQRLFNQQAPHDAPFGSRLMRYQPHTEHPGGKFADLTHRLGDLHATTLAASARMDLCLIA